MKTDANYREFNMSYMNRVNYERLINVNDSIEIIEQYIVCKNTLGVIYSNNTQDVIDLESYTVAKYNSENIRVGEKILKTKEDLELLRRYKRVYRDIEKKSSNCLLI